MKDSGLPLGTAEVYVAAVLSRDKAMQDLFRSGGDLHSQVAKLAFNLPSHLSDADIKRDYSHDRSAAKAITFGILYSQGPQALADSLNISLEEAKIMINNYFARFPQLKSWLEAKKEEIRQNGCIYSIFGRKRRVKDVFSSNSGISGHAERSAMNFLFQSVASDVNLLAAVELNNWLVANNKKTKMLALVHDSIMLEVKEEEVEEVTIMMKKFTQKDRGCSIPGFPISVDIEIGNDYSFGKWEKL